jgi:riboflavin-specific deaminase-like protein
MESITPDLWRRLLRRSAEDADVRLFGPLLRPGAARERGFVLGRLAQSLDGFIAMRNGASRWIGGAADLAHTHRLRALFDAVVVGAGTVRADDPQLTTRLVEGPSPVRVVIDPGLTLGEGRRVFAPGPPTILVCAPDAPPADRVGAAEVLRVPCGGDGLDLQAMLDHLHCRGLHRIFVEGGGITVSRFLRAGLLDRLHVTVAPLLIGAGIPAFPVPPVPTLADAPRFVWEMHRIGDDLLLDIPLERGR